MLQLLLHCIPAQSSDGSPSVSSQAMQLTAMRKFFGIHGDDVEAYDECITNILTNGNVQNPCEWTGISCTDGNITCVSLKVSQLHFRMSIDWLPSTVETVVVTLFYINSELHTALLPQAIKTCRFVACNLHGSLALHTLPRKIALLGLQKNAFSGVILLKDLPQSLVRVYVTESKIDEVLVVNAEIPKKIAEVQIHGKSRSPKIRCVDEKKADIRIHTDAMPFKQQLESLCV